VRPGEEINIRMDGNSEETVRVKLVDMMGEEFYINTFDASELIDSKTISTRKQLKKGVYILMIHQGENVEKHRVVVKD
jgi:hypothetical protein